jgi:hypothetical protein
MNNTPTLMQSEEERAPWNKKTKTITVNISQCLSTTVDIEVPEDFEDYDNSEVLCDFVREQIVLPSELTSTHSPDCWYLDEFWVGI